MDKLFHELIRLSVGSCSVLSSHPSSHEWQSLLTEAIKQAIDGVSFEGFLKCQEYSENVQERKQIKLQWIASVLQLEQRNELTNLRAQQLTKFFKNCGFRTCVLKGQGVAYMYPKD